MKYLILLLLLLTSCSYLDNVGLQPNNPDKINYINNIVSCTVYLTRIDCLGVDGNTYYVMRSEIDKKVTWDKSAWKVQ